jgi:hypothetical protein
MSYQFTAKCNGISANKIWAFIQNGLSTNVTIKSIKEQIPYNVNHVTQNQISFSAESRNGGEPEIINLDDFVTIIERLKVLKQFNTSSAKEYFKGTRIYKKRSPFFALLLSSGVIERV